MNKGIKALTMDADWMQAAGKCFFKKIVNVNRGAGLCLLIAAIAISWGNSDLFGAKTSPKDELLYREDRILVKLKKGHSAAELANFHSRQGGKLLKNFPEIGDLQIVELAKGKKVKEAVEEYRQSGLVEYAEPDYALEAALVPNDPNYTDGSLWGLNNTGQNGGVADSDIDAPEGWGLQSAASNIIVAVIDTGIRYTHEDLATNMWKNLGDDFNGIDDDGDGYIDDRYGINAISNSGDPYDDNGHGTHVSGTLGAAGNNGKGVTGVAWRVQIMACKFLNSGGTGFDSDAIKCIDFARQKGAKIMNNSWTGYNYSQALYDAINNARSAGIIFVAAAGNQNNDNDLFPAYPASYELDNIVSVASTARDNTLSGFSNTGLYSVDLGAPGSEIFSCWNSADNAYTSLDGTSMATAVVSGTFALVSAHFPTESYLQILNRVYSSTDAMSGLSGKCRTGGRINLNKALTSTSAKPLNDAFASRTVVASPSFRMSGINTDGTKEAGEPNHAGNVGGKSVWWSWTAPSSGIATVTTAGSSFNTLLGVYTGTVVSGLTTIASNDDETPGVITTSRLTFTAIAGTTYQLAVDGFNGASGSIVLDLAFVPRPANDDFANRTPLTGANTIGGALTLAATKETGEPNHAGNVGGKSVWWSWTAPFSRTINISTKGSTFDTILGVYTGSSVSGLTAVASNDNDPSGGTTSRVTFSAVSGTTYQIAVDGLNGASGTVVLNAPALNDSFSNPVTVTGSRFTITGANFDATKETGEPNHGGSPGGKSVWFKWVAPATATMTLTTKGSNFDTVLGVYTGSSVSALSTIAGNSNDPYGGNTSRVTFNAVLNTTYYIAVDGEAGAAGSIQLTGGDGYLIFDPGILGANYDQSWGTGINNAGSIVGYSYDFRQDYSHAFVWTASGGLVFLGTLGGPESEAEDINDYGVVVGGASIASGVSHAFLWTNNVMTDLGTLGGPRSWATAINNKGDVVGWSDTSMGILHAFLWKNGVGMQDLGTLGGSSSRSFGINNNGDVVGQADTGGGIVHAFLWKNNTMTDLGTLGGSEAVAYGINDLGQVVGYSQTPQNNFDPFLWTSGTMQSLGQLYPVQGGGAYSPAYAINNNGEVVGTSGGNAWLWKNNVLTDLKNLLPVGSGWEFFSANDITDNGEILGSGAYNGTGRVFLLSPAVTNLLTNPSFELDSVAPIGFPDYWMDRTYATRDSSVARTGQASLRFNAGVTNVYVYPLDAPVLVPNSSYVIKAWVRTQNVTGTGRGAQIRYSCTSGSSASFVSGYQTNNSPTWVQVSVPFTVPSSYLAGRLDLMATLAAGETAWFDDVSCVLTGSNAAPTVSITSPSNGATFTAPANITINATAADSDGTISKVEFFQGATKLGEDLTSPYSFAWNGVAAGSYALTAKATDNGGAITTSSTVNITVNSPSTNLLLNGDMETDALNPIGYPDNWWDRPEGTKASDFKHGGTYSLRVSPAVARYSQQAINLLPGTSYTLRGWVKTSNVSGGTGGGGLKIRYAYTSLTTGSPGTAAQTGSVTWTQLSTTFTSVTNSPQAGRVDLYWDFTNGTGWFDDVELIQN